MSKWCFIIAILLLAAVPTLAQDDEGGWRLVSAQRLEELIPGEYTFEGVRLSPDGSKLLWSERGDTDAWCIYTFADETVNCVPREGEAAFSLGRYNLPVWSPDSTEFAFHQDLFLFAEDSDLWTYDLATGTFTNHTDDGFEGSFIDPDMPDDAPFDYAPAYNPADGLLYFFRSVDREQRRNDEPGYTLELWRLSEAGEPEQVVDLTLVVPGPLSVYLPPAFSPDGAQLAFAALPSTSRTEPKSGVWVLDMETLEARQLVGLMYFNSFKPDYVEGENYPNALLWGEGGLVVETVNPARSAGGVTNASFYLDVEDGALTPLLDVSQYESMDDLQADESETGAMASMPVAGVISPDGTNYWYLSYAFGLQQAAVRSAPLPFTSDPPEILMPLEFWGITQRYGVRGTSSSDGKALIYDLLLTFEQD